MGVYGVVGLLSLNGCFRRQRTTVLDPKEKDGGSSEVWIRSGFDPKPPLSVEESGGSTFELSGRPVRACPPQQIARRQPQMNLECD